MIELTLARESKDKVHFNKQHIVAVYPGANETIITTVHSEFMVMESVSYVLDITESN